MRTSTAVILLLAPLFAAAIPAPNAAVGAKLFPHNAATLEVVARDPAGGPQKAPIKAVSKFATNVQVRHPAGGAQQPPHAETVQGIGKRVPAMLPQKPTTNGPSKKRTRRRVESREA